MTEIAPNIVINPDIRFGKPIIKGTRITVEEVLGYLAGGMEYEAIEKEFGITKAQITTVLNYVATFLKGENIEVPKHSV